MIRPTLLALALFSVINSAAATPASPLPHSPGTPYAASGLADRIVLTPGANPAREMAVTFRTDTHQQASQLQLAVALDGPQLAKAAHTLEGTQLSLDTENGPALYHQVRLHDLQPDTAYVYRVKGAEGWSEWLQFRTAAETFKPFSFIYMGDVQNDILSLASRSIRQALRSVANPALIVHAGDLVSQRDDLVHDDQWGEWNQAGGYNYGMIPQVVAIGNHEYLDGTNPDDSESRTLSPHWNRQFALPDNGVPGLKNTTYVMDYQGVRFIVLDGTAALDMGTLAEQTKWLENSLKNSPARWNIVVNHQPVFTCARPEDTEPLKAAWKPLFERYKVDLVLQGHDHCYSRVTSEAGRAASRADRASGKVQGPVYMVSVAGSKMYGLNDRAHLQPDRSAEETQLYQTIDVQDSRLEVRSYTAAGKLYDAFDLKRDAQNRNHLSEPMKSLPAERACTGTAGPDGYPCSSRGK
ncbi:MULTISPECIES: metallophosphoesterase family protein [unclassified Pseudomonas]|uniref:purple acid phosphatase family protein n=1 Tax=unclassified Pseudomonas TaxID=196821 RepID=UPI001297C3DE|nr:MULTISPECIES: metallophosphoesterase family protein [unclassified Pseudomonas]MQT39335.1 hydrolase [Pseudomonas sp. FSL R10-0765]MQT53379.1 hydrolase [Pseudomonas sp. FSL R10-2398]MQU01387.1 hydrolase [Pseudomonas sp. FSL R10-2245]MQU11243.1 hydrolase [Pseudomonas sp. FSL R10-2189]MQU40525.1 hydrolase [Pseudomonas sp. FSL R10-2172]